LGVDGVMAVDMGGFNIVREDVVPGGGEVTVDENLGEQKTLVIVVDIGENKAPIDVGGARHLIFDKEMGTVQDYYIKNLNYVI